MPRELTYREELQSIYSDFYKDVHGFRPRHATPVQWNSIIWLKSQMKGLHDYLDSFKSTFEGREFLREQGWDVEETNPIMAQWAKWLAEERKRELEEFYDSLNRKEANNG